MNNTSANDKLLHHYTSIEGFDGIIRNHSFRMTKSTFLNDPSDCSLFVTIIKDYIERTQIDKTDILPKALDNNTKKLDDNTKKNIEKLYQKCDFIDYIKWLHNNISLYIASFTNQSDDLTMWNYYGQKGIALTFYKHRLIKEFRKTLTNNEFLIETKIFYVKKDEQLENIPMPKISELIIMNGTVDNILEDHQKFIDENSHYTIVDLYNIKNAVDFVKAYIEDYIKTLIYLFTHDTIHLTCNQECVFEKIFCNNEKFKDHLYWKHDFPYCMLILSSLLKPDTYAHEQEHRLVYCRYGLEPNQKEEYTIKDISSDKIIGPYVSHPVHTSLDKVTLSPFARNLTIEEDEYKKTLKRYLNSNNFTETTVDISKHIVRF